MQLTETEAQMIQSALRARASEFRRDAKSRRWTGERFVQVRQNLRTTAKAYDLLAERVKLS